MFRFYIEKEIKFLKSNIAINNFLGHEKKKEDFTI